MSVTIDLFTPEEMLSILLSVCLMGGVVVCCLLMTRGITRR